MTKHLEGAAHWQPEPFGDKGIVQITPMERGKKMTYAEQQAAINSAIENLRNVADTISNPYLEDDLRKAIKSIQHLSDSEMEHVGSKVRF